MLNYECSLPGLMVCPLSHFLLCDSFEESDPKTRVRYEEEFLDHLEKLVRDLDWRIARGRDRLQRSIDAKQKVV